MKIYDLGYKGFLNTLPQKFCLHLFETSDSDMDAMDSLLPSIVFFFYKSWNYDVFVTVSKLYHKYSPCQVSKTP